MDLEQSQKLALETDYACEAVGEEINTADAAAFFLEGYLYAQKENQRTEIEIEHRDYEWDKSMDDLKYKIFKQT